MNDLQGLFSVVFGIYFAATVGAIGRFRVFDTTAAMAGDLRAALRTLAGILFLDVLPFLYYLGVLSLLRDNPTRLAEAWTSGFGVLFAGLGGFGIYRVFAALLMVRRPSKPDRFLLYSHPDELRTKVSKEHASPYGPDKVLPWESLPAFLGGVVWLGMCLAIFFGAT